MLKKFVSIIQKYYSNFARNPQAVRKSGKPLAWVTSFVPIEILYALDIEFVFPESYAAVIAASSKGDHYISKAYEMNLDSSICSYSTCFNGSFFSSSGPRGIPFKPDVLIATNNQCNTLPGWWNNLSLELDVPVFVLDYPGEEEPEANIRDYVKRQHRDLIAFLEKMCGTKLDESKLRAGISNSREAIGRWKEFLDLRRDYYISCQNSFDYILPLIVARCFDETKDFYHEFKDKLKEESPILAGEKRLLWHGYPLWHHHKRYIDKFESDSIKIIADDYSSWWNLEYSGPSWEDELAGAYNYTYLNRNMEFKKRFLASLIDYYTIDGIIFNANKSCKRESALVLPLKESVKKPSVIITSDMVDSTVLNKGSQNLAYDIFGEIL